MRHFYQILLEIFFFVQQLSGNIPESRNSQKPERIHRCEYVPVKIKNVCYKVYINRVIEGNKLIVQLF